MMLLQLTIRYADGTAEISPEHVQRDDEIGRREMDKIAMNYIAQPNVIECRVVRTTRTVSGRGGVR